MFVIFAHNRIWQQQRQHEHLSDWLEVFEQQMSTTARFGNRFNCETQIEISGYSHDATNHLPSYCLMKHIFVQESLNHLRAPEGSDVY